jgi:TonB family protein
VNRHRPWALLRPVLASGVAAVALSACATRPAEAEKPAPLKCIEPRCVSEVDANRITPETVAMFRRLGLRVPVYIPPTNYPDEQLAAKLDGSVIVTFDIDVEGNVAEARVVSAEPAYVFDQAALEYIRQFKFEKSAQPTRGQKQRVTYKYP